MHEGLMLQPGKCAAVPFALMETFVEGALVPRFPGGHGGAVLSALRELSEDPVVRSMQGALSGDSHICLGEPWAHKHRYEPKKAHPVLRRDRYFGLSAQGIAVYEASAHARTSHEIGRAWKIQRCPWLIDRPNNYHADAYLSGGATSAHLYASGALAGVSLGIVGAERLLERSAYSTFLFGKMVSSLHNGAFPSQQWLYPYRAAVAELRPEGVLMQEVDVTVEEREVAARLILLGISDSPESTKHLALSFLVAHYTERCIERWARALGPELYDAGFSWLRERIAELRDPNTVQSTGVGKVDLSRGDNPEFNITALLSPLFGTSLVPDFRTEFCEGVLSEFSSQFIARFGAEQWANRLQSPSMVDLVNIES